MNMDYVEELQQATGLALDVDAVPEHIAIVMDGNGRWAKQRGLERTAGHRAGVERVEDIVMASRKLGVKHLTLYAFSTENWRRPMSEVGALMSLLAEFATGKLPKLRDNQVEVRVLGDLAGLPMLQRAALSRLIDATANVRTADEGLVLNLALNYGGRAEILQAAKRAAQELSPQDLANLTEEGLAGYLSTAGQPDPDLLIRTSGEQRLSNFLLWQLAYAEFYFSEVLWPDFDDVEFFRAICAYQQRNRRFGAI